MTCLPCAGAARRLAARRAAAGLSAAVLLLTACTGDPDLAETRLVEGYAGMVAADEPRAALVGREVLGNNGNAADAAVAMAFTMTATLPSRVGLGGGGACMIADQRDKRVDALTFLPRRAPGGGMVPGLARGLAALHARHGAREWREVVAPAEQYARFGHLVSRAFHRDLSAGADRLTGEARERFLGQDGQIPQVGDRLKHPALSAVLSGLRQQGAGYLYAGGFAGRLAEASEATGRPFSKGALLDYAARYDDPVQVAFGNHQLSLPPTTGGAAVAHTWGVLREGPGGAPALAGETGHWLAAAWTRTLSELKGWLARPRSARPPLQSLAAPERLERGAAGIDGQAATPAAELSPTPAKLSAQVPTAGFAVADRLGNLVACGFTMNGLFGLGQEAGGTGVLLAAPAPASATGAGFAPAVIANPHTGEAYLAASGADGGAGVLALAELVRKLDAVDPAAVDLSGDLGLPRLYHPGKPDQLLVEPGLPETVAGRLRTLGHTLVRRPGLGRLNAVYCARGADEGGAGCQAATDPRGHGLSATAR